MREIKFRAWDKKKKEMDMFAHNRAYFGSRASNPREIYDEILMQFTGLKDKNGKEVYEGDVVEVVGLSKFGTKPMFGEVVFGAGSFTITQREKGTGHLTGDISVPFWNLNQETIEIIGNIYEHSHLLNQ